LQMLTSILRNLVSNAIKFTPEGGNIEIMAVNQGRMIEVSVSDSGVGMDTENLDKLFRLDSHFSQRGTNNEVGTGLGLILVKEFVEKNQGKISVWSEPGKGSIFTFSIPNSTW
jgi:signal transduction histidine kinase